MADRGADDPNERPGNTQRTNPESARGDVAEGGQPATRRQKPLTRLVVGRPVQVSDGPQAGLASGAPAISSDGRFVAFVSTGENCDVYVRDLVENVVALVSRSLSGTHGNAPSIQPAISADGRFVAFTSSATDLVTTPTGDAMQVYLHDLRTGQISLVSRADDGHPGERDSFSPSLSADGRFIAFTSLAQTLDEGDDTPTPDVYLHDRVTGHTELISTEADGTSAGGFSGHPTVSAGGRLVAFATTAALDPNDDNDVSDVYVHDTRTHAHDLVSRAPHGGAGSGASHQPSISADGSSVAFASDADDLVAGDDNSARDVFMHRRGEQETELVSRAPDGSPGNDDSHSPSISGDGRRVAFLSEATDLAPAMDDAKPDVDRGFVRDLDGGGTALVGSTARREPGDGSTSSVSMSSWGRHVAFSDDSTDLSGHADEESTGNPQVYEATLRTTRLPAPLDDETP